MLEQIVLLKNFILNAPAPAHKHDEMLTLLQQITQHYQKEIQRLIQEVEKLKEEKDEQ